MIKLYLLFSLSLFGSDLGDILSPTKRDIFNYKDRINELESSKLESSWVNPLRLRYSKNYTEQFADDRISTGSYSVVIDQPIFKSGGIFWSVKYANTSKDANGLDIEIARRKMVGEAVNILFRIKQLELKDKKTLLLIRNDDIDIKLKADSYEAGILDSSFLDQAIIKRNADETARLALQMDMERLLSNFASLSDKNPKSFVIPKLKLFNKDIYTKNHLELRSTKLRRDEKELLSKMIWTRYLPEVSLQGQYSGGDGNPIFQNPNMNDEYFSYGVSVSMPININSIDDIESGKVAFLEASTIEIDSRRNVDLEYDLIIKSLELIDRKIDLDKKDAALYKRLYSVISNLAKAGEKTAYDVEIMKNSMDIKMLDQEIHKIDKQIQLLNMYIKVNSEI
ncbi:MAG: TolC family protein [Sulfurovum sp.]|nr:TolC family protein [Sulfurovaceae bacterium]